MKKIIVWVSILIVVLVVHYTVEPFTLNQPLIKKTYTYPPLDIYPYPRSSKVAQTAEDTFVVLNLNDILKQTTPQPAQIYTAFVINDGTTNTITFDNLKKYYFQFMNNSSNYLRIKQYNPEGNTLMNVNVKDINLQPYTTMAIQDSTHFLKFIQFTGVTNPVIRSIIAEALEQAISLKTPRGGQFVSICLYNNIPDDLAENAPKEYYVQSVINFPFITLPMND